MANSEFVPTELILEVRKLYSRSPLYKAVFDIIASGKVISDVVGSPKQETGADDLQKALESKHPGNRSLIVGLLQEIGNLALGQFVVGRGIYQSRILWHVDPIALGKSAQSKTEEVKILFDLKIKAKNIGYDFLLRPDLKIHLDLPSDLTKDEAQRFSEFIKNCLLTK